MRIGDLVRLRTGSPTMAIVLMEAPPSRAGHEDELVECVWLEGKEFKRGMFKLSELEAEFDEESCAEIDSAHAVE
jgi:uncharacterized protein YodC (DUF2158 family)